MKTEANTTRHPDTPCHTSGRCYPSHTKVPDSLYKLADVEQRLGNNDKAKGILQQVIAQFPSSSAAQLAQRDLKRL